MKARRDFVPGFFVFGRRAGGGGYAARSIAVSGVRGPQAGGDWGFDSGQYGEMV